MATDGRHPVTFYRIHKNAFYFEVGETDVDADAFAISRPHGRQLLRSNDSKVLLLTDGQFQAQNLTKQQECLPECKFDIQFYKDSSRDGKKGRPVMLYAMQDGKKMVVCCNEKHEIYPEAMDLPSCIEESTHRAVFYLEDVPQQTNKFTFKSSVYPTEFLSFKSVEENPGLDKLVLRHKSEDQVDESCEVLFSDSMNCRN